MKGFLTMDKNFKISKAALDSLKLHKEAQELSKSEYLNAISLVLLELASQDKELLWMNKALWNSHTSAIKSNLRRNRIGVLIDQMEIFGCKNHQAFKALADWTSLSFRAISDDYFKFRKIISSDNVRQIDNSLVEAFTIFQIHQFFDSLKPNDEGLYLNPFNGQLWESPDFPNKYPVAKRAYIKVRDKWINKPRNYHVKLNKKLSLRQSNSS